MDWKPLVAKLVGGVGGRLLAKFSVFGTVSVMVMYAITRDIDEVWRLIKQPTWDAVTELTEEKTGMVLDRADPISDPSISAALTERSGIQIHSVMSADGLVSDLSAHASGLLQAQTGILLTNLLSAEQVKVDLVQHAETMVYDRTGVDLRGEISFDGIQKKIGAAVEKRLAELVVERLRRAAEEFSNPEATLDELLAMVYHAEDIKGLRARDVALGVAASMVVAAYARLSTPIKRRVDAFRRRAQNRASQRRFRARHGNRMTYNKLPPKGT